MFIVRSSLRFKKRGREREGGMGDLVEVEIKSECCGNGRLLMSAEAPTLYSLLARSLDHFFSNCKAHAVGSTRRCSWVSSLSSWWFAACMSKWLCQVRLIIFIFFIVLFLLLAHSCISYLKFILVVHKKTSWMLSCCCSLQYIFAVLHDIVWVGVYLYIYLYPHF